MSETRRSSPSGASQGRRAVLKLALSVGLLLPANLVGAQNDDPRKARPQANDRFVFARGDRKGQTITVADLSAGGPPVIAFPIDPVSKIVRDGSRLNEVFLVRLESSELNAETRARAADGSVVAYSAVCTHTGCDEWDWQRASGTVKCPCHFSEFDLKDSARVLNGPAPRRLPALPISIVDGVPVAAGGFVGRPGFESGGG
jgi:rieske iron-sulfur protein